MRILRYYFSFIQKLIEFAHRKDKGLNVLMFHQVSNDIKEWKDSGVCITESGFLHLIEELEKKSYEFISVDKLNEIQDNGDKRAVLLTFDDIFQDAYKNAFPILIKKGIPFCVFIAENYIDQQGYITSDEAAQLARQPLCTIGYHTKSHSIMRKLTDRDIEDELDCRSFESRIGQPVEVFAFPYGSVYACSYKSIRMANRCKYSLVFSTIKAPCTIKWMKKRQKFIPRININENNFRCILKNM